MNKIKYILMICMLCILTGCTSNKKDEIEVVEIDGLSNISNEIKAPTEAEKRELITSGIQKLINDNIKKPSLVDEDLEAISALSPEDAVRWEMIIDYWNKANESCFVGEYLLPDNLPNDDSLCIVVLGYQLETDGSMRDELIGRLETTLENLNQYPNAYVVVTGGGTAAGNPSATEADCMAQWLIENGVDSSRIIIENKSRTTVENAVFSYRILTTSYPDIHNIAIITSDYHITLGCVLFNAEFLLDDTTDIGNMKVVANAAYECGIHSGFTMQSQADWLINLYSYH